MIRSTKWANTSCSIIIPHVLRRFVSSKSIKPNSLKSADCKLKSNDSTHKKNDENVTSYYSSFKMISNSTAFETRNTDIDVLEPPTLENKVRESDWVRDLEERKQSHINSSRDHKNKAASTRKDVSSSVSGRKEPRSEDTINMKNKNKGNNDHKSNSNKNNNGHRNPQSTQSSQCMPKSTSNRRVEKNKSYSLSTSGPTHSEKAKSSHNVDIRNESNTHTQRNDHKSNDKNINANSANSNHRSNKNQDKNHHARNSDAGKVSKPKEKTQQDVERSKAMDDLFDGIKSRLDTSV
ncbi:hypothetical protein WICPIJ_009899 [Wickerhamomyces pijperi]|uniref:Uncharacterized protein n=1 Tax=Wickerhamomyces pijperi TaxID=599730 RepID=A0A9P8TBZ2_WICPI|nr:hypothetical protein WICPIJ_009899 [Wickerhamomyces pijperi]